MPAQKHKHLGRSRKRTTIWLCFCVAAAFLCGCTIQPETERLSSADADVLPAVQLTVWGAEEDTQLLNEILDSFKRRYASQADLNISLQPQGESGTKDAMLADPEAGADVFAFADDQLSALAAAGVLEPVEDGASVRSSNIAASVDAASLDGTTYAYPLTADNGYFLYYNKEYFSDEDVATLDGLLQAAQAAGKAVSMDWSSAWYLYSFFGNTGLEIGLNPDGITNFCTWNSTEGPITGVDVAEAMLAISSHPAFSNRTDEEFLQGVQDGSIAAGVSGVWNDQAIREAWGDNVGAVKLPTYTVGDQQVQMASFSGSKLVGVNSYSDQAAWADLLAQWITNESNQRLRFEQRGQGPSNLAAASSPEVQQSEAIAALLAQSEYAQPQRVGSRFWDPVAEFGTSMAAGNPSGTPLQEQLDRLVEGVTAR